MAKDKVLVVEDDLTIRTILDRQLRRVFNVTLAENGEEGLEKARIESPDLIISDVMMPKMDGFQLKEVMREEPALHLVPFIFLTSKSDEQDRLHGLMTGADDYLVKPFDVDVLIRRVRMLIDRSRVYREDSLAVFAKEINAVFGPDVLPAIEGIDLFCRIKPAKMGGGDFIDIVKVDDDNYTMLQGDVMGKGVKAKFFAYAFTGYFRGLIHAALSFKLNFSPAQLVNRFSAMINSDPFLQDVFITFFLFNLNARDSTLTYCNAGYMPGLLVNHRTQRLLELNAGGGIPGFYVGEYEEERIDLVSGDTLVLCSDGVNEAKNIDGEMLGDDHLRQFLLGREETSAASLGNDIYKLVESHVQSAIQYDDISIAVSKKL
jgi:serine phosphatase RsbU (regulator of sigma subunit)